MLSLRGATWPTVNVESYVAPEGMTQPTLGPNKGWAFPNLMVHVPPGTSVSNTGHLVNTQTGEVYSLQIPAYTNPEMPINAGQTVEAHPTTFGINYKVEEPSGNVIELNKSVTNTQAGPVVVTTKVGGSSPAAPPGTGTGNGGTTPPSTATPPSTGISLPTMEEITNWLNEEMISGVKNKYFLGGIIVLWAMSQGRRR